MLLNEQKKQALERYINQFYTLQQIANTFGKRNPTSQEMEIMHIQTTCIAFNPHPENDDSDIPPLHPPAKNRQFQQPTNQQTPLQQPATNRQNQQPIHIKRHEFFFR